MIAAAVERAKRLRRKRIDDEITASVQATDGEDFAEYQIWEAGNPAAS